MSIYKKYFAFQNTVKNPKKDSSNPHFKSKYVDLEGLLNTVKPALEQNGLIMIQTFEEQNGISGLATRLLEENGQGSIDSFIPINPDKSNMQGFGSAVTYLRRYSIETICGICGTLDDDGNGATGNVKALTNAEIAAQLRTINLNKARAAYSKANTVDAIALAAWLASKGMTTADIGSLSNDGLIQFTKEVTTHFEI